MPVAIRRLYALALVATALMLGPGLAHVFALPNKIGLDRDAYAAAQGIYQGWAWLGLVVVAAIGATAALAWAVRRHRAAAPWAWAALAGLVAAQAVFWAVTQPANAATANWTRLPDDWERLRLAWEASHAAGAAFVLAALAALVRSLLAWVPGLPQGSSSVSQ